MCRRFCCHCNLPVPEQMALIRFAVRFGFLRIGFVSTAQLVRAPLLRPLLRTAVVPLCTAALPSLHCCTVFLYCIAFQCLSPHYCSASLCTTAAPLCTAVVPLCALLWCLCALLWCLSVHCCITVPSVLPYRCIHPYASLCDCTTVLSSVPPYHLCDCTTVLSSVPPYHLCYCTR